MPQSVRNFAMYYFKDRLQSSPKAIEYLHYRGLTDKAIDFFNIGYDDGSLMDIVRAKFDKESVEASGLVYHDDTGAPKGDFFRNRVVFQSIILGNLVYATARDLSGKSSRKYLNLPTPQKTLINEEILRNKPKYIILSEGYLDCYSLIINKFPSVAVAGCNRAKKELLDKIMSVPEIYIMFDNELNQSGQKGAIKTAYNLCQAGHKCVRIATIPRMGQDKIDINDLYCQNKVNFVQIITDVLLNSSQPFHTSPLYTKMVQDEMAKPIVIWDVDVEQSMNIYQKYMEVRPAGNKIMRACCPFHMETKPSFTIYRKSGYSLCYGCGLKFENGVEFEEQLLQQRRMTFK